MRPVFVCAVSALALAACSGAERGHSLTAQATKLSEASPRVRVAQALTDCTVAAGLLAEAAVPEDRRAAAEHVLGVCGDGKDAMKAAAGPDDCLAAADGHYLAALLAWDDEDAAAARIPAQLAQAQAAAAACQRALVQA
jgi:hypothetical protein